MKRTPILLAAATLLAASSASAATIASYDFETAPLAGDFDQRIANGTAVTNFTSSASGGVSGATGSLTKGTTDTTLIYTGAGSSLDFSTGQTYTVSSMFKMTAGGNFGVGFMEDSTEAFAGTTGFDNINFRWSFNSSPSNTFQSQSVNNGVGTTAAVSGTIIAVNNNWYKITLSLTRDAGNTGQFFYTSSFEDYGSTGTSLTGSLYSGSGNITNNALWSDTSIYAAARMANSGNIDNFSLSSVPEPSTYGLMGAGALAAVAFVRRRRKHAVAA